ncbi:hypothetical protein BKA66DRAFT_567981 [Pyrenochaeta sp. MPI-SDFR-AT-0127]|nr:hypothetical protein BKA66DRAFT_567981 [Pyrenochaeta sp. MPI-SDFR-AT-0127]
MLRRLHKEMGEDSGTKLEKKKSKRQRLLQLFRWRKARPQTHKDTPTTIEDTTTSRPSHSSKAVDAQAVKPSSNAINNGTASLAEQVEQISSAAPPSESKEGEKVDALNEAQLHALFAGAPHFSVLEADGYFTPRIAYPWDTESTKDGSDSVQSKEAAFLATTLHKPLTKVSIQEDSDKGNKYKGYEVGIVEIPNMLSAQGIEPGSIGLAHFLGLPRSDSLVTDLNQSQSSKDFLEATRNKELMQADPERIGIRPVRIELVHDRLIELQGLYEAFQDSPQAMTILNNQSSGDLYTNLFTKFITPPGHDGSNDDPSGLNIQITALLRVLKLKGVWYDFSLVEWRIRLGQVLWSDAEATPEHEPQPLWTEREILLLQITLACELLLRLDAVTDVDANDAKGQVHIGCEDVRTFFKIKSRKVDWDLVLARRFLDNILVVKGSDETSLPQAKSKGILSLLGVSTQPESPPAGIVLLPQHQARQLSGLFHFAKKLQWPNINTFSSELANKLGIHDNPEQTEQRPSTSGKVFDPTTPSSISIYGTPLQTPRSANHILDNYFGHVGKPPLNRHDSRSLRVPLSSPLTLSEDRSTCTLNNVGGWLSRSYLTGLILPGEAISHFLISTLLENDKLAIIALGDSANLYGGFTWGNRSWWSKNSIVGRVLACVEGSAECMGWITCAQLPQGLADCWHSIQSEQLPYDDRLRTGISSAAVIQDSAIIPDGILASAKSEDLVLPSDPGSPPTASLTFTQWELTPLNPDLMDTDTLSDQPTGIDIHVASLSFTSCDQGTIYTFSLAYDVHFVTSWPCNSPASAPSPITSLPHILRQSFTKTLSRSSSKRSETLSRRNSHGFEPLLSHPPASADIAPKRMYSADTEDGSSTQWPKSKPMNVHPLHKTYMYKMVPVTDVLDPKFVLPFALNIPRSATRSPLPAKDRGIENDTNINDKKTVLVLDARSSSDLELLARAWCAENGLHAIIGRVERTCLACCVREARGLGINIVIRV